MKKMKKTFYLFRSNLRQLEPYHMYKDLRSFRELCHDFYLNQGLWFLDNNVFDEVVVWRLQPKSKQNDIIFDINGKKFIQKFVDDFSSCFSHEKATVSLFRGGFQEYDRVLNSRKEHFGLSLYLGAGRRILPQYGGRYDIILVEDERDLNNQYKCLPFYKTAHNLIFKPLDLDKSFDICWICNFTQLSYKGQEFFIDKISKSNFLRSLKIIHIGNNSSEGKKLCKKYGVVNISFLDHLDSRSKVNIMLNRCKFGLVTSNLTDGCPRVSTEVMMSGTPLLIRDETRLLKKYKENGVIEFTDSNLEDKFKEAFKNYDKLREQSLENTKTYSMDNVCKLNLSLWGVI